MWLSREYLVKLRTLKWSLGASDVGFIIQWSEMDIRGGGALHLNVSSCNLILILYNHTRKNVAVLWGTHRNPGALDA